MPESDARAATPFAIVHVAYATYPADTRVRREARALAADGHRVAVVALQDLGQAPEEVLDGMQIIRLPGKKSRQGPFSYVVEYAAFVWRCRRLFAHDPRLARARVVHVHTLPDFLVWAATPAQRQGARVVLDLHEIFPEFVASKYAGPLGRLASHVARYLERDARRRAAVTITVNRPVEALLHTRGIGRAERLVLVHNSADPEILGPRQSPAPPGYRDRLELIYHGTLTPLYGVDVAIRGVAQARQSGAGVHLTVLGDGPQRDSLRTLARSLGIDDAVTFEDPIPQEALRVRLSRADAGVVPTRLDTMTRYSLSNKLLEYVHLGLPVLAARLPSYSQYLGEESAWYWTPGRPDDLARSIASLAAASPLARAQCAARAQRDLASIAWAGERDRLVAIYRELLAATPPRAAAIRSAARASP